MNSVHIIGRLARDPEVRYTQSGKAFARFTLAVDRRGGKDKGADFIPCQAWDKLAETIGNHTQKGSKIAIEGRIQTGSYEKNGQKVFTVDVVAHSMEFCDSKAQAAAPVNGSFGGRSATDEEIPF